MSSIRRHPSTTLRDDGRPESGDDASDYDVTGRWSAQHGLPPFNVFAKRIGDDHVQEEWLFDAERTGEKDEGGHYVELTPTKVTYAIAHPRNGGVVITRTSGGSPNLRRESVDADDVPPAVIEAVEDDHTTVLTEAGDE